MAASKASATETELNIRDLPELGVPARKTANVAP